MRRAALALGLAFWLSSPLAAGIPATPLMTLYRFNAPVDVPFYDVDGFRKGKPPSPAGTLAQGTSVVPCVVVRNGRPLTDPRGIPYVGFRVVVDSRTATPEATETFRRVAAERRTMTVPHHHCDAGVRHVLDARNLYPMGKAPLFDTPPPGWKGGGRDGAAPHARAGACLGRGCERWEGEHRELDQIIRAFHDSPRCEEANRALLRRGEALARAWDRFAADQGQRWPRAALERAKQLDHVMRTALFEGHLDRGCGAYGACERNVIALSIRNRAVESCYARQGCRFPGDFQGVATAPSQYNIWDEFLSQISGLTSCYLRPDPTPRAEGTPGKEGSELPLRERLRRMHEQSFGDVLRILLGGDDDLREVFPGTALDDLKRLRHYYHAPAMGKCFPGHPRVEYVTGAVAAKGNTFALIANSRVHVDERVEGGYRFREAVVREEGGRDVVEILDRYPGFILDEQRVTLAAASRCAPYGIPNGCPLEEVGRYRKTPPWLTAGRPIEVTCRVRDTGEQCRDRGTVRNAKVGGACDLEMRPVTGVH